MVNASDLIKPVIFLQDHVCRKCKGRLNLIDSNSRRLDYKVILEINSIKEVISNLLYFRCDSCNDVVQIEWRGSGHDLLPYPLYNDYFLNRFMKDWEEE